MSVAFRLQSMFPTDTNPVSVTVADVNVDGKPDLITANKANSTVSVLLGLGDGTFAARTDYAIGMAPTSAMAADVNGDGKLDLVAAASYDNAVSVLFGLGDGTFALKTDYTAGPSPQSVTIADLNGDGSLDLVTADSFSNALSVLLGNGDGTFAPKTGYTTSFAPYSGTIADVNGDGNPDLIASCLNDRVSVLLGRGDGTFAAKTDYATGAFPSAVTVADVNLDSKADLITADRIGNAVSVLLGRGDGTFAAKVDYATGFSPHSVTVSDANRDGNPDLVIADQASDAVSVLLGRGDGSFAAHIDYATGSTPESVVVADLNHDGLSDIVTADFDDNAVSVLLGVPPPHDFGGDGYADILLRQTSSGNLVLAQLNGSHQAATSAFTDVQLNNDWTVVSTAYDFDGDGKSDILFRKVASGSTLIAFDNGSHQSAPSAFTDVQIDNSYAVAATADFNGDGKADLLFRSVTSGATLITPMNGSHYAAPSAFTDVQIDNSFAVAGAGDFNGDGKADILFRKVDSGSTLIAFQNGSHQAAASAFTDVQVGKDYKVWVADFDGDGNADLLFRNVNTGQTAVTLMDGSHQKAATVFTDVQLDNHFEIAQISDFNGDGKADILFRDASSGSTLVRSWTDRIRRHRRLSPTSRSITLG